MAYPNIIVSGAGLSYLNKTYPYDRMSNGKPIYDDYNVGYIFYFTNRWAVMDRYIDDIAYWAAIGNEETPDLATGWVALNESYNPSPFFTAEQSGTTHEGEATLSSLSYLRTKKS